MADFLSHENTRMIEDSPLTYSASTHWFRRQVIAETKAKKPSVKSRYDHTPFRLARGLFSGIIYLTLISAFIMVQKIVLTRRYHVGHIRIEWPSNDTLWQLQRDSRERAGSLVIHGRIKSSRIVLQSASFQTGRCRHQACESPVLRHLH